MLNIWIDDTDVIHMAGRFDAAQGQRAGAVLDPLNESLIIDMTDLEYISSLGLGILVNTYKRLNDSGQTITMRNLRKPVKDVFFYTSLNKLFIIE